MPKEQIKVSEVKRTRQKGGTVVTVDEFLSLERPKGDLILKIGREQVSVTSLDRIYWPDEKLTKFDLLSFYLKVADYIMPFLAGPAGDSATLSTRHQSADVFPAGPRQRSGVHQDRETDKSGRPATRLRCLLDDCIAASLRQSRNDRTASVAFDDQTSR